MLDKYLVDELRHLVEQSFSYLTLARKEFVNDDQSMIVITGYISVATSYLAAARAFIVSHELTRQEFTDYIREAEGFIIETLDCIRTEHGFQGLLHDFDELQETYTYAASLLGIDY